MQHLAAFQEARLTVAALRGTGSLQAAGRARPPSALINLPLQADAQWD